MEAPSRRAVLRTLAGSLGALIAAGGYAFGIEPAFRLRVAGYAPTLPGWPANLKLRIVALADPHAGEPYMPLRRIESIVERALALEPDLILLLGDYLAAHRFVSQRIPPGDLADALRALRAPLGTYAILGNHDWWEDAEAQRRGAGPVRLRGHLERAGIPVLENDAVRLVKDGQAFWILGLGDQLAFYGPPMRGVDDLAGTLAKVLDDAPAILLAHEPDIFPSVPPRVALTLSGHTHGGQIRLFGYSPVVPSRFGNRYAYGHVVEKGRHLIVSGGLGTSIAPVRFGVPPEILLVELGAAQSLT